MGLFFRCMITVVVETKNRPGAGGCPFVLAVAARRVVIEHRVAVARNEPLFDFFAAGVW